MNMDKRLIIVKPETLEEERRLERLREREREEEERRFESTPGRETEDRDTRSQVDDTIPGVVWGGRSRRNSVGGDSNDTVIIRDTAQDKEDDEGDLISLVPPASPESSQTSLERLEAWFDELSVPIKPSRGVDVVTSTPKLAHSTVKFQGGEPIDDRRDVHWHEARRQGQAMGYVPGDEIYQEIPPSDVRDGRMADDDFQDRQERLDRPSKEALSERTYWDWQEGRQVRGEEMGESGRVKGYGGPSRLDYQEERGETLGSGLDRPGTYVNVDYLNMRARYGNRGAQWSQDEDLEIARAQGNIEMLEGRQQRSAQETKYFPSHPQKTALRREYTPRETEVRREGTNASLMKKALPKMGIRAQRYASPDLYIEPEMVRYEPRPTQTRYVYDTVPSYSSEVEPVVHHYQRARPLKKGNRIRGNFREQNHTFSPIVSARTPQDSSYRDPYWSCPEEGECLDIDMDLDYQSEPVWQPRRDLLRPLAQRPTVHFQRPEAEIVGPDYQPTRQRSHSTEALHGSHTDSGDSDELFRRGPMLSPTYSPRRNSPRHNSRSQSPKDCCASCLATPKRKKIKDAPKYNGKSELTDFLSQFEILAVYNEWSEQEKGMQLATSLDGEAREILSTLSPIE